MKQKRIVVFVRPNPKRVFAYMATTFTDGRLALKHVKESRRFCEANSDLEETK